MDLFLHNYIADMPGPHFLGFYFVFLIVAVMVRSMAVSMLRLITPAPRVPKSMDPYKFAYLRGGDVELLGAVQFSLYQRGYLAQGEGCLICAPGHPEVRHLRPVELSVFEAFQSGSFDTSNGTKYIERYGRQYEAELQEQGLLVGPSGFDTVRIIHYAVLSLFGGLGLYKLAVAMMKGYTKVTFLVGLTVLGLIVLIASRPKSNITLKGEKYLRELRGALDTYKTQLAQRSTNLTAEERALAEPQATLIMAVFGAGVLLSTAYGDLFASATPVESLSSSGGSFFGITSCSSGSSSSSFFSSSCSSFSSCSTSSCSSCSSCGGCGGGGCGGCGG